MKQFQNRVAVITGAASGFGREFANLGARLGMKLVLADVQQDALQKVEAELAEQGAQVLAVHCDVSKAEQVQALADAAMARFGAVHLLFNNAGVAGGGLVWENSKADWDWVLGVNLFGVIHGVRIFTPLMLECAKRDPAYEGHIVNTASVAGLQNAPTMGIYNVSKHAVVSLTETLYQDLRLVTSSISTSLLCPFFVPTGIHQSERNRPDDMHNDAAPTVSQRAAQSFSEKAVISGKISAAQIAEWTFDAIRDNRFYIFSEPESLINARKRMEDIVQQRNPYDPYEDVPHIRELLKAKLAK
ncbi:SDR family oxidoreductase [Herminiimonas fonticola]|uniref:NADP-dependent 3-hydroxy acid dehydrogenase YdfG n=1 Tax=Herminiimonas fonticola TaxID=303380 RepID=A0A4R6G6V5_9BURK|nr:SDR family oxidoreductase [Herminiimonas fonticola]RBA24236.1 Short-chain alcohol dehydrogenase [Herminiimonas fonticola]TDN90237.1 NADP-dependent 3-hydroxy acid dehydrogenase YdfG [Herminiimonas fonticola]